MIRKAQNRKVRRGFQPKETDVYREILSEREWISQISHRPLNEFVYPMNVMIFAHILNKNLFPKLKFKKENILLVYPEEHILLDHGTIDERNKYEKKYQCSFEIFFELRNLSRNLQKP